MKKKKKKVSKFKTCSRCGVETSLMICQCGNPVWQQKSKKKQDDEDDE